MAKKKSEKRLEHEKERAASANLTTSPHPSSRAPTPSISKHTKGFFAAKRKLESEKPKEGQNSSRPGASALQADIFQKNVKDGTPSSSKGQQKLDPTKDRDGTPFKKKLRPSLRNLRIAGCGESLGSTSKKKRDHAEAGGFDKSGAGSERATKKPKKEMTAAISGNAGTGSQGQERMKVKDKKGKKPKRGPTPVKNEEKAREGNNEIAQFANRKMLKEAQECFETAIKKNLANNHTYTIMINAHVRCGDADGAAKVLKRMCKASLQPCVVAYTTLINGKCRAGDLLGGMEVLRAMLERRPPVLPNVRTVNTLLRGCLLVGGVSEAKSLLDRMQKEWGAEPDASTYESVVVLLAQALRLEEAGAYIILYIVHLLRRTASYTNILVYWCTNILVY